MTMALHENILQWMTINDNVWQVLTMYDNVWHCMTMCDNIWQQALLRAEADHLGCLSSTATDV